jgi:hypothetical protein
MDRYQFDKLNDSLKGQVLIQRGVFIAQRIYKCFRILLVQVDHFYVEVYYHLDFKVIQCLRSFENMNDLEPYLQSIDLTSVLPEGVLY